MTIAEVSKKYDISADTLRYYERIGLIPHVPRNPNGIRNYNGECCGWIEFMKCMRSAGVHVEALIEYRQLFEQGDATADARKEILVDQRNQFLERIDALKTCLSRLNYKIEKYDSVITDCEKKLKSKQ